VEQTGCGESGNYADVQNDTFVFLNYYRNIAEDIPREADSWQFETQKQMYVPFVVNVRRKLALYHSVFTSK